MWFSPVASTIETSLALPACRGHAAYTADQHRGHPGKRLTWKIT
jgi:hypothetical protein